MTPLRLRADQLLSRYGYCSRSEARGWLRHGRLTFRGETVQDPAQRLEVHDCAVDGQPVEFPNGLLVMYHKPAGLTCSHEERDGPTIYEQLPPQWSARNPPVTSIGRLDKDTTGLLLLTDQGEWVHQLTSPRHKIPKLYEVEVAADFPPGLTELFAAGTLRLDDDPKPCVPARLELLGPRHARLELTEGRYHQVKRMFGSQGCPVIRLHRSRFGAVDLGNLEVGNWRPIQLADVGR
jgi:16S rRNA pseudouridine516 synthase